MINLALRLRLVYTYPVIFGKGDFFLRFPKMYVAHSSPPYDIHNPVFSKFSTLGNVLKKPRFWWLKMPFTRGRRAKREKEISVFQKKIRVDIFFACGCAKNDLNTLGVDAFTPFSKEWMRPSFIPYERVWLMLHWMMN